MQCAGWWRRAVGAALYLCDCGRGARYDPADGGDGAGCDSAVVQAGAAKDQEDVCGAEECDPDDVPADGGIGAVRDYD